MRVPLGPTRQPLSIGCEISALISTTSPRLVFRGTLISVRAITGGRRHLRLVNDRAVSGHDTNVRLRHRDIQASEILWLGLLLFQ